MILSQPLIPICYSLKKIKSRNLNVKFNKLKRNNIILVCNRYCIALSLIENLKRFNFVFEILSVYNLDKCLIKLTKTGLF